MRATNIEIDVLIAEKLMGWKIIKVNRGLYVPNRFAYIIPPPSYQNGECWTWNPSIDTKAAWEVVEKLCKLGWLVTVQANPGGLTLPESRKPVPAYMVTGTYVKGRDSADPAEIEKYICARPYGCGATLPEAVCRMVVEMIRRKVFAGENARCPD